MKIMKKLMLVVVIAMLGVGAANAQFRFGVKAGLNLNKLHLSDAVENFNSDNGCGFTAGLMTEFQIPVIGLCFDASLMYTRMNSDFNMNTEETVGKNFLEIPINIKYKFGLPVVGNVIAPYIFTGPSFAIKLDKNSIDYIKSKTCQVAWNVGIGVQLVNHLQIGASYGFGINNVIDKITDINTASIKCKNNYWTITAAYLF